MKRIEEYSFLTECDQTVVVESDFEGIKLVTKDNKQETRLYLSADEAKELLQMLTKSISYQEELKGTVFK